MPEEERDVIHEQHDMMITGSCGYNEVGQVEVHKGEIVRGCLEGTDIPVAVPRIHVYYTT